ncbi:helix-turn-helix domain-containing protein [Pluralibacter gergoviae]|nr:helix-turn-helix domain-containing protein [Pluralibacter gergoviae]ELW9440304.1 helix-turn-helix domain-containing protein [Pluralibacter gergoviae]
MFKNLHREFQFTLDGAARECDALLPTFTSDIDSESWKGHRVFVNPPFSQTSKFLEKASEADLAVFVIPARVQTSYWLKHIWTNPYCHEVRFCHRTIKFEPPAGHEGLAIRSPFPSAVVVFRATQRTSELRQTICCADTLLALAVTARGGYRGRPTLYNHEQLDKFIRLHDRGVSIGEIAKTMKMPLSTAYRIAARL